jgi:tetratricopeptide (TPR) repeat protein
MTENQEDNSDFEIIQTPWKNRLLKSIQDAKNQVFIITPCIKRETIIWITNVLLEKKPDTSFKINILTRINEKDIIDGRSDLESLEAINNLKSTSDFQINLKSISNLQASAYIFDDDQIILTSTNLAPSDLTSDIGYGIKFQDKKIISGIIEDFNKFWEEAGEIESDNLKRFISKVRSRNKCDNQAQPPYISIGNKIEPKGIDIEEIVKETGDDMVNNYIEQAMEAEDSDDYEKALDYFSQALLLSPDNTEALENKARLLIDELNQPDEALECLDKLLAINHEDERSWREKGKILYRNRKYRDALMALDEASKLNPNGDEVWFWKGLILSKFESRREDAIACFDQAIYLNSYYEDAWFQKGIIFYQYLDKPKESIRCFQGTLRINPEHEGALLNRAIVYYKYLDKSLEAMKSVDKLTKQNPGHVLGWQLKGIIFLKVYKKYKEALICVNEALKHQPENVSFLFFKGRLLYRHHNQSQKALKLFDEIIKLDPDHYFAMFEKGLLESENYRNIEEALQYFDDAIDLYSKSELKAKGDPPESELEEQDLIINAEGIYNELIERLNDLTTKNPGNEHAWYIKGAILDKFLDRFEDSLICLDEATKLNPDYGPAWHDKGAILDSVYGRNEDAIKCYNKALSLNADNEILWYNKGNTLAEMEDYNEALECFNKTLELNPDLSSAWSNKGNVLINLEMYDQALEAFNKAIGLYQYDVDAWYNKGNVLIHLRRFDDALVCFETALNYNPTHESAAKNYEHYSDKENWK